MSATKRKAAKAKNRNKQPPTAKERGIRLAGQLLKLTEDIRNQRAAVTPDNMAMMVSAKATAAVLLTLDY